MPQRLVEKWLSVQNLSAELLVFKRVSPTDNRGLLHIENVHPLSDWKYGSGTRKGIYPTP